MNHFGPSGAPSRSQQMLDAIRSFLAEEYGLHVVPLAEAVTFQLRGYPAITLPMLPSPAPAARHGARQPRAPRRHGLGFRTVIWDDEEFYFTELQAKVIALLWEQMEAGTPDVPDRELLKACGPNPPDRLRDLFRDSPSWGRLLIESPTRGSHRLAVDGLEQAAA
jgi:hypothetical protein